MVNQKQNKIKNENSFLMAEIRNEIALILGHGSENQKAPAPTEPVTEVDLSPSEFHSSISDSSFSLCSQNPSLETLSGQSTSGNDETSSTTSKSSAPIDEDGDLIIEDEYTVPQHMDQLHLRNKPTDWGQYMGPKKNNNRKKNSRRNNHTYNSRFVPQYDNDSPQIDWTAETEETVKSRQNIPLMQVVNEAKERWATEEAQKKVKEEVLKSKLRMLKVLRQN